MAPTNELARVRPWLAKLAALVATGTLVAAAAVGITATAASAVDTQGVTSFTATPVDEGGVRSVNVSGVVSLEGINDPSVVNVTIAANGVLGGRSAVGVDALGKFSTTLTGDQVTDARYVISAQAYSNAPDAEGPLGSEVWATATFGADGPIPAPQPAPTVQIGAACLADDGVSVKPFGYTLTWDDPESRQFDILVRINALNDGGTSGEVVYSVRGMAPIGHFETADITQHAQHLGAGTFFLTAYLVDYYRLLSTVGPNGAIGGVGSVNGEAVVVQFTIGACNSSQPSIQLSAPTVVAGSPFTISVTGARPGEQLSFTLHSDVVQLGAATADENGNASLTATIPANVPVGTHTVMVDGDVTHLEKTVTVTEASTPTDPANPMPVDQGGHKIPTTVQTDGNQAPVLWLTASVLLMALATAGGAGLVWRRARR